MAHEKSEPKVALIMKIAVLAIATVVIIRWGLTSYFQTVEDDVRAERLKVAEGRRPSKYLDKESKDAVEKSMADIAKAGEASFVHPVTTGSAAAAAPCWAAVKCKDAPAAPSAGAPPAPKAPGQP